MCYTTAMSNLSSRKIAALRRERQRLLEELSTLPYLLKGSYLERFSTCSRPHCSCHQGERHGPRAYVVINHDKAQRQVYVPQSQVDTVRTGIQQYHRLLAIVERITSINLELMQGGVFDEFIS